MWYDKLGVISIGVQNGGPEDGGIGDIKIDLWKLFLRHCRSSRSPAVDHYALAVRTDGKFQKFGKEGIERVRRRRADRYIGAEIIIPESVWRPKSRNELRDYLATQVRAALQACVARLRKDKERVDEVRLFGDVDTALSQFGAIDYELKRN
jgi:hypothetical protein